MRFLHAMMRVSNLEQTIEFLEILGLKEVRRRDSERGRFTLVFMETGVEGDAGQLELTHNWDETEPYSGGRNFGHLAYEVDDIYGICERMQSHGVTILRPPRDGRMAFIRTPDQISIELLQRGPALELREPWKSMPSTGEW
jgi:lactoylglutathione lyase